MLDHPEGLATARTFDRTFQFDLSDGAPFYVEVKGGKIKYAEGDSGLDWQYRDWKRATCVRTSTRVLEEVVSGKRIISDAFFDHEIGFAPRRGDRRLVLYARAPWARTGAEEGVGAASFELVRGEMTGC